MKMGNYMPAKDGVVYRVYITYNIIIVVYFHVGILYGLIYVKIAKSTAETGRPLAAVDKPIRELMNFRYSREVQLLFHRTYYASSSVV